MRIISTARQELIGECIIVFLDDILVYSPNLETQENHLRRLFDLLQEHKLLIRSRKCTFGAKSDNQLGHRVSADVIATQNLLTNYIHDCLSPPSLHQVRQFLCLSNYYRKLVRKFADMALPFSDIVLTKTFEWEDEQLDAFQRLKHAFISAPVLRHASSEE